MSALDIIKHFSNSLEELRTIIQLLEAPPNETVYSHAFEILSSATGFLPLPDDLAQYLLNFWAQDLAQSEQGYRTAVYALRSLYTKNHLDQALDILEETLIAYQNLERQAFILYEITRPFYGLREGRKRLVPKADVFIEQWRFMANDIDSFTILDGSIQALKKIEQQVEIVLSPTSLDTLITRKAIDKLLETELEEVEEVFIQLLTDSDVDANLKKYILLQFFKAYTLHVFTKLLEIIPVLLAQWHPDDPDLITIQEKYLEAQEDIKKENQKFQRYLDTGYWK